MNQKGVAPILIVLIIAILIGGYLLYQNKNKANFHQTIQPSSTSTDITANWKTYTNKDNYFSFKYPPMFTVTEKKDTFERTENGRKMIVNDYQYSFSTGKIVNGIPDFSGFIVAVTPAFGQTITQNFNPSKITILPPSNGADETATYHITSGESKVYRVKDNFFQINGFNNSNVLPDESDLVHLDQILSTFKFLP